VTARDDRTARTELAEAEARLSDLLRSQRELVGRIAVLREALEASETPRTGDTDPTSPSLTAGEKVSLFLSLFRGRDDVFPRLWSNTKTGKKGYAPACSNEWVRGICEKPRVKCGECPSQAFISVSQRVILDHLQGRHVIGCYPILRDETCWFLAVDFDKSSWREDVAAFRETCRTLGAPVALERSRSGNGAHAWFFFGEPVAAATARRMASYILTETMTRRHEIGLDSYDRLFPNQDTMPKGGFGNLISLPLQQEPRKLGNTVFLDETLVPIDDQWRYLAALRRMTPGEVASIASAGERQGQVLGVPLVELEEEEEASPWLRPRPRPSPRRISGVLPAEVSATLASRIFVRKAGLPSPLLCEMKRLAAFQNPEFYKRQGLRLSTALTPRVIGCAEELSSYLALPRGCLADLQALLLENSIALRLDDERDAGTPLDLQFLGRLTETQELAARDLLRHDTGVLSAPPGFGKTVVGAYAIAARATSTLVLVHRQPLLAQWVSQLALHLGLEPREVGRVGGGSDRRTGRIDVAIIQSLVRGDRLESVLSGYGHVVVDECHHIPAVSFERVLSGISALFVVGLTATVKRRDGHHPILHMQLGPVRHSVGGTRQAIARIERQLVIRDTEYRIPEGDGIRIPIQRLYALLAADERRNSMIVEDVRKAIHEGRSPLVLTERRDHLELLADRLRGEFSNVFALKGGPATKRRREELARLTGVPPDEPRVVLATGRFAGEGFDDARLDTLFLALPISWKGTLVQYAGRLHRDFPGKTSVRVVDYVDRNVPMLARMWERRRRAYHTLQYSTDTDAKTSAAGQAIQPLLSGTSTV